MVFTSLTDSEPFISFFCNVSWWRGNRLLSQEINDTGSDGHGGQPWVTVRHLLSILRLMPSLEVTLWFISGVVLIDTSHHYGRSCWERSDQGEWLCRTREAESINKTTPPGPARVMCQLSCYDPIKWWIIITKYLKWSFFWFLVLLFYAFSIIIHLSPTNNNCTTLWLWCEHRLQRTGLWCVCCVSRVSHSWSPGDPLRTEHRDQRSRSQGRGAEEPGERGRGDYCGWEPRILNQA